MHSFTQIALPYGGHCNVVVDSPSAPNNNQSTFFDK